MLEDVGEYLVERARAQPFLHDVFLGLLERRLPERTGRLPVVEQQLRRFLVADLFYERLVHDGIQRGDHRMLLHRLLRRRRLTRHADHASPGAGRVAVQRVRELGGTRPLVAALAFSLQQA